MKNDCRLIDVYFVYDHEFGYIYIFFFKYSDLKKYIFILIFKIFQTLGLEFCRASTINSNSRTTQISALDSSIYPNPRLESFQTPNLNPPICSAVGLFCPPFNSSPNIDKKLFQILPIRVTQLMNSNRHRKSTSPPSAKPKIVKRAIESVIS